MDRQKLKEELREEKMKDLRHTLNLREAEKRASLVRDLTTSITGIELLAVRFVDDEGESEYLRSVAVHLTELLQKKL